MGEHINTKHNGTKRHKKGFSESLDVRAQRAARVSFKSYMQNLEDDLLEQELSEIEFIVEHGIPNGDETNWIEVGTFRTEEEAEAEIKVLENTAGIDEQFRIREL